MNYCRETHSNLQLFYYTCNYDAKNMWFVFVCCPETLHKSVEVVDFPSIQSIACIRWQLILVCFLHDKFHHLPLNEWR